MEQFPEGFRPIVLSEEETARREAEKLAAKQATQQPTAEQSTQTENILAIDDKAIQLDVKTSDLSRGDVLVEKETALDAFMATDKKTYTVEDTSFKNGVTGKTEILLEEGNIPADSQDSGMDLFLN